MASVILPRYSATGADLTPVHTIFAAELAGYYGPVTQADMAGGWRDEETGAEYTDSAVAFHVSADWTAKGGRMARRLENMAARYADACEVASVAVQHDNGETVYVSPMRALMEEPPMQGPSRMADPAFLPRQREDKAARFERLTA